MLREEWKSCEKSHRLRENVPLNQKGGVWKKNFAYELRYCHTDTGTVKPCLLTSLCGSASSENCHSEM